MMKFYRVVVELVSHNPTERIGEMMLEVAGPTQTVSLFILFCTVARVLSSEFHGWIFFMIPVESEVDVEPLGCRIK